MATPRITAQLWDHQKRMETWAIAQFNSYGFAHFQAGCAVGKTLTALSLATRVNRTLVLTLKSAITTAWINDIGTKTEGFKIIAPTSGTVKERLETILAELEDNCIVIINYEAAMMMADAIPLMHFDLVVADEVHKLKAHDSKRSKELAIACWKIPNKLGMTGTSWNDRPTDVYGQFRFYKPAWFKSGRKAILGSSILGNWYSFFETYVVYYLYEKIKIPTGYKNLERLGRLIDPHIFYLKTEDAIDLPPVQHIDVVLPMTDEMRRAYRDMEEDMIVEFGEELMVADCALACATRLHQLTSGVWTNTEIKEARELKHGSPKTDAALDIIDSIGGEPVVIFTRFDVDVKNIEAALDKAGVTHLKVVGGTYEQDRWVAGEAQVLICNMAAGATGLNLQRARYAIFYSTGHSATDYEQALWRVRRPGSDLTKPIVYYHLLIEGSIDRDIQDMIQLKNKTAAQLLERLTNRL